MYMFFSSIQFYDELSQQESSVDGETEDLPQPVSMVTKVLQLSGLSVEFDYTHLSNVNLREEQDSFRGKGGKPSLGPRLSSSFSYCVPGSHPAFRRLQYEKLDENLGPRLGQACTQETYQPT